MGTRSTATPHEQIRFEAELLTIDDTTLVRLPEGASHDLPSRGQVAVHASIDGYDFDTVVEPDGRRGHWIRLEDETLQGADVAVGERAVLTLSLSDEWPEPSVPDDLGVALADAPESIRGLWDDITPMARWEWVRWVQATRNPTTRQRRVDVSISKMSKGNRRPCCFDLASCTDPELARSGKLRQES